MKPYKLKIKKLKLRKRNIKISVTLIEKNVELKKKMQTKKMSVVSKLYVQDFFVVVKSFGVVHFFRVVLPKFEELVHLVAAGFKLTNLVLLPPRLAPLLE